MLRRECWLVTTADDLGRGFINRMLAEECQLQVGFQQIAPLVFSVPVNVCTFWLQVSSDAAIEMAKRLAVEEGLFCGISSGAATVASIQARASMFIIHGCLYL